ncbi:hypothetical protein CVV26_01530 [Candidatus Kuenenbacteria bacterium HGW-Kuenenbacteria-1]|uniref:PilN domain-containing protein n=1 Tax=Candidatus Kuenenbacteria bacterium HGW-Kuenenbacteria-1 TaxID=2013812 RepID=A0A2N1UNM5_9BACT|nr:MAG: hypothetical protein CVV26_01530 [Candidatus Kuenenbacteria bacterium HGW-Kuenenbacteria-1]
MDIILNLISPKIKKELKIKQIYQIIRTFLLILFLMTIFTAIILIITEFFLQSFFVKIASERVSILKNNQQNFNKKIKTINQGFNEISDIQNEFIPWSKILIYFTQIIPSDIKIYSFKNINNSTDIKIVAIAKNREALLKFQEDFKKKQPIFTQIKFPFFNLASKKDINFQFEATLDKSQIK